MSTKERAEVSCRYFLRQGSGPMFIYRVGPAWMFTSNSFKEVQDKYKVPVKEYQEIKP